MSVNQNRATKFTLLPKHSVELYAETVGCPNLGDNVLQSLSEDVTYRLKETMQNAIQVMKHCKRRCMTTGDFATAMKWSDNQPIYGHNGIDVSHFKSFNFKDKNISYIDDKDLHLREVAFDQTVPADPGDISLKAQWLVFEGHSCTGGKQSREEVSSREVLEEPFASFLHQIISATFGKNAKARKVAVEMIRTSCKLQTVLPYLVTFLASQVKACNGSESLKDIARGTLLIVQALVDNTSLFLIPYVLQIVKLLLFVITEGQLPASFWECKLSAARILTQLCRRHMSTMNYLPHHLLKAYQESLHDDSKSLGAVYGAAFGISCLGAEPTHQVLYPVLIKKCEKLKEDINSSSDPTVIHESLMVYGLLQDIAAFLLRTAVMTSGFSSAKSPGRGSSATAFKYFAVYGELIHVFGEGIIGLTHFPNLIANNFRTAFHHAKFAKQDQNSKIKDILNQDIGSIKVESCEKENPVVLRTRCLSNLTAKFPTSKSTEATAVASALQTSLGIITSYLKWRQRPVFSTLQVFKEPHDDFSDVRPTKAKKRKVENVNVQPYFHTIPGEKRDLLAMKYIRKPRISLIDLAKTPATLNILF